MSDNVVTTHCNKCCWAEWIDDKQVGCSVGRLDKFKDVGAKVEQEGGYYTIDRYCNKARANEWFEHYDEPDERLHEECLPKLDVIIVVEDHSTLEELEETLLSLSGQTEKIHDVKIILNKEIEVVEVLDACREILPFTYKVFNPLEKDLSRWDVVNEIVGKRCDGEYYCYLAPSEGIDENTVAVLNYGYNELLKKILLIEGENLYPTVINRAAHLKVLGNDKEMLASEKILKRIREEKLEHLYVRWSDLWNCLS